MRLCGWPTTLRAHPAVKPAKIVPALRTLPGLGAAVCVPEVRRGNHNRNHRQPKRYRKEIGRIGYEDALDPDLIEMKPYVDFYRG